jgi:hypothetical protein
MILLFPERLIALRTTHLSTHILRNFSAFPTIAELHPRNPRHFAYQLPEPASQTLRPSYLRHTIVTVT